MQRGRLCGSLCWKGKKIEPSIGAMKTRRRAVAVLNTHFELRMLLLSCVVGIESCCRTSKYCSITVAQAFRSLQKLQKLS